jgi:hypothetical protein
MNLPIKATLREMVSLPNEAVRATQATSLEKLEIFAASEECVY